VAKLPSVSTITTGYASVQALNDNFEALKAAFTNTVSRDGSTPNSMSADLDLNSNDVKNVKTIDADKFILDGTLMTPSGVDPVYSGTISTLGANLIDDTTGDAMLDTMGITASVAQLNYSNGVTSSIQSQLDTLTTSVNGKQSESDILTDLSGLTQAANKIPYFDTSTTASTLDFKDEDNMSSNSATAVPSQQSVKAYVDNSASGVGIDQTWQDVLSSRSSGTVYQNTTGNPIMVFASQNSVGGTSTISAEVSADNVTFIEVSYGSGRYGADGVSFIVPNNHYYKVTASLRKWAELR
jgi:hypothetical protein